ncbi:endonuclease/exonuclease/phosphatase family protein [Marinicella rhabdoformis]|uniref:endonuclease/exonuclease/phosphatase family protein n=1 Tax=Marinicella rhabdoformis TaxID=2580566 RepID=UPI0012AEDF72|nr:endonuclease/exonuclease/phosphatase family protein [Marinicella rhabdoformis]
MQFKVLTYNIHRAIGLDRRYQPKRIIKILKDIDADIVLLQEVDSGVPRSQFMDMAKVLSEATDYPYYDLGLNVNLPKGHYGNATFSRYPIRKSQNIDLTIDNKKARGCLYTEISCPTDVSKPLHVFNWHLGLSAKERRKQCAVLLNSQPFKKLNFKDDCLVAGDFNDWRSLLRILFVEGREFKCATDHQTKRGEVAIKTYPSFSPRGGLDRIYYRGSLKCLNAKKYQKQIAKVASDHLPIYATFEM